ncbi:MAG: hypothetical protein ACYC8V_05920 [Caulobacteraceae bacterium]
MRLSIPELDSRRALLVAAGLVTVIMWTLLVTQKGHIAGILGDTDDAMRLVLARDLLAGRGWWDQWVGRLQPPVGSYMQWSQLLTGALAGSMWLLSRILSPATAEWATRFCWPLLLVFPGVLASLAAARGLAKPSAILPTACLLLLTPNLYVQFVPGRIDHHNLQIVLAVGALAAAVARTERTKFAALAGVLSGLGLAIGLEAMLFHALIGASFALRLAADPQEARPARAYGLALAASTLGFFALQTPPWRWSLSYCDSLGLNLVAAVAIAGGGLALVTLMAARALAIARLGLVAGVGLAAAGAWFAFDPNCLRGPFEAVDPRVRGFWFDRILEIQPWWKAIVSDRAATIEEMTMAALALAAALFLAAREWRKPQAGTLLAVAIIIVAIGANAEARRMQSYVAWFGVPILGAAISRISAERLRGLLAPMLIGTIALSPLNVAFAVNVAVNAVKGKKPGGISAAAVSCFATNNYARLARLPAGLVLSETDLGPFILADTPSSVLAAPYHRMSWGILAAHDALDAPPDRAEAMVRRLGVTYVVDCPSYPMNVSPASFGTLLRRSPPDWLEPLSAPRERIRIYRVRPPAAFPQG